jgi:exodeoxyribonuclease VII small subunit
MAKKADSSPSFEKQLEALQQIVDRLESGQVELEPSLALFEEGVGLYQELKGRLEKAETRVEKLILALDGSSRRVKIEGGDSAEADDPDADEDG